MATLTEQIHTAMRQHRIWIDSQQDQAEPFARVHSWCGASLPLDYSQQSEAQVALALVVWMNKHKNCTQEECKA